MTIGRRRDAWERAAKLISAWTGEPIHEIMPNFGGDAADSRSEILPYNENVRAAIVKEYEGK